MIVSSDENTELLFNFLPAVNSGKFGSKPFLLCGGGGGIHESIPPLQGFL